MSLPAPYRQWKSLLASEADTTTFGVHLGESLQGGEVIALYGDLGAGKTTFVRALGKGMGKDATDITSPTFVLIQEYPGHPPLVHADLYRIESRQEYEQLGLSDYFDGVWVVAIEWAEKMSLNLPQDRLEIHLSHQGDSTREILLQGTGRMGVHLVDHMITKFSGGPPHSQT